VERGRASLHSKPPLYFLGGFGIDTSLHLCFTFISVYAILCELCSACMEIKITKLDEEKVYTMKQRLSTLEYFC